MRRLAVDSYPSLFLIEGSLTRKYQGIRAQEQVYTSLPTRVCLLSATPLAQLLHRIKQQQRLSNPILRLRL